MIFKKIMEEATFLGGVLFYLLFLAGFLITQLYESFFVLLSGLMIIYLLTFLIRIFYFKPRPERVIYKNFVEKLDASSFPSVHAARATFLAIFLLLFLKNIFYLFFVFILAFCVFYSRIYLKKHSFVDVLGGILSGIFTSLVILVVQNIS